MDACSTQGPSGGGGSTRLLSNPQQADAITFSVSRAGDV